MIHICGIAFDRIMKEHVQSQRLQLASEGNCGRLSRKSGYDHASDIQASVSERVDDSEDLVLIGDPVVVPLFALLDISSTYGDNYLCFILDLHEHPDLTVRFESGKDSGRMVVVKQFSSEFQIQFPVELSHPLSDVLRLFSQIFLVVKTGPQNGVLPR